VVIISLDFEHGDDQCGIIQFSCEVFRADKPNDRKEFDRYVNPGPRAKWNPSTTTVHKLTRKSPQIVNAPPIESVWAEWFNFIETFMKPNDVGRLVAWKGQSSDLLWIFCLTKTQEYKLDMPTQIQYFMDPCYVIEHYT
jgi:hypothetical protein